MPEVSLRARPGLTRGYRRMTGEHESREKPRARPLTAYRPGYASVFLAQGALLTFVRGV